MASPVRSQISTPITGRFDPLVPAVSPGDPNPETVSVASSPEPIVASVAESTVPSVTAQTEASSAESTLASVTEPTAAATPKDTGVPSDEEILKKLADYDSTYLVDLWRIYLRLNNQTMVSALQEEINRRDPALSETLRKEKAGEGDSGPYIPSPLEQIEDKIDKMMVAKKTSEAITYMESLRSSKFKGNFFPFEKDLADAYADAGRMDDARAGYMRVTEDPKYPDALRAEAKAQLLEIARLDAVKAGYALLEARQYKTAMAQAIELLGRYPNDPETKVFHAQALTANNRFTEALPILEKMRDTAFRGGQFPGWDALAECLQATGRLNEAKAAFERVAADPTEKPYDQAGARRQARYIERLRSNRITVDAEVLDETEGKAGFFAWEGITQQSDRIEVGVRGWMHDVSLTGDRDITPSDGTNWGAVAEGTYRWENLFYSEAWAGGGNYDGLHWGIEVGREQVHPSQLGFLAGLEMNAPAIDSLQLVALEGLEDRAFVGVMAPLAPKISFTANASLRRVSAQGVELGDGFNAEINIEREMYQNREGTVRFTAAFRGEYRRFNSDTLADSEVRQLRFRGDAKEGRKFGDTLVEPEYAPQGIVLGTEVRLSDRVVVFAEAGVARDLSDNQFQYHGSVGVEVNLTKEWDLVMEGSYYSDGVTGVNNDGSLWVATAGLRNYY